MARASYFGTAAAVDHADTELIGHHADFGIPGLLCCIVFYRIYIADLRNIENSCIEGKGPFCPAWPGKVSRYNEGGIYRRTGAPRQGWRYGGKRKVMSAV